MLPIGSNQVGRMKKKKKKRQGEAEQTLKMGKTKKHYGSVSQMSLLCLSGVGFFLFKIHFGSKIMFVRLTHE